LFILFPFNLHPSFALPHIFFIILLSSLVSCSVYTLFLFSFLLNHHIHFLHIINVLLFLNFFRLSCNLFSSRNSILYYFTFAIVTSVSCLSLSSSSSTFLFLSLLCHLYCFFPFLLYFF
jgi:hypothetical protein